MDMSDDNKGEEIVRKGNEWEVVVLTESAYAAAPGPKQDDILDNSRSNLIGDDHAETARAMFMSGHFGFSPSTDENLQVERECKEKCCGKIHDHDVSQVMEQQGGKPDSKHEEDLHIEGLISDEFPGVQQFNEKDVASLNLIEKEQSLYSTQEVVSYDDKAAAGMSYMADEGTGIVEPFESLDHLVNPGTPTAQKHIEDDKYNELPNLPCEAWWRKPAASLYGHVKNANPIWSIFVAAAVVGIVIIGRRWQREKPQFFQLKRPLVFEDEGSGWALGPMSRLKYVSLSGQHSSYIGRSSPTEL